MKIWLMNCVYFEDNTELCRPSERTRKWQIYLYVFWSGKSYIFNTLYGKQLSHRNVSISRSKLSQTLGLGHVIQVESWITFVRKAEIFPFEKVRQHWKFFIVNDSRRTAYKIRSCIVLKDAFAVANEHHSCTTSTCLFTFSVVVVVDLPIDCILSFLFPAETHVLVPVLSQSTDVVVVNFVVVLKFPNIPFGLWPYGLLTPSGRGIIVNYFMVRF